MSVRPVRFKLQVITTHLKCGAEVKNARSYSSTFLYIFMLWSLCTAGALATAVKLSTNSV